MEPRSEFQFPLDARPYFRRAFPLAGVGTTIGWIVSRALHLRAAWFTWKHGAAASSIAEITSFSALEWPQESSVTPHSACLYLARRPDYLDWRYFENPRSKYRALGSFDGKRLRGYVVFGGPDHSLDGNTLHLVDWWTTDPADDHTLRSLVSEVVRRAVAAGCTTIRAQASGSMTRSQLRRSGMLGEAVRSKAAGWHCRDRQQGAESFAGLEWSLTGLGDDMDCGRA